MKNAILFLMLMGTALLSFAQDDQAAQKKKFFGGAAFWYFSSPLEITGYSSSNSIDGEQFEWHYWPGDEIDEFNGYVRTSQQWMVPALYFGMKIIDMPQTRWSLTGEAALGYMVFNHEEVDKNTGTTLLDVTNDGGLNLSGNLAFDLKYRMGNWFLAANPAFISGVAQSEHVDYNYLPEGNYQTYYTSTFSLFYPKLNLLGGYAFRNLSVYAGAGAGWCYARHHLEISKNTSYQTFGDDIKADFVGCSKIRAVAGFDWLIADRFLWKAKAEFGIGWLAQTSLSFVF